MSTTSITTDFFERYTAALLARDEQAVAALYAVPALIVFPQQTIALNGQEQAAAVFGAAWPQYEGVTSTTPEITIAAETDHSIWADVTWRHGNGSTEHQLYQLVYLSGSWRVAVLTPMA